MNSFSKGTMRTLMVARIAAVSRRSNERNCSDDPCIVERGARARLRSGLIFTLIARNVQAVSDKNCCKKKVYRSVNSRWKGPLAAKMRLQNRR